MAKSFHLLPTRATDVSELFFKKGRGSVVMKENDLDGGLERSRPLVRKRPIVSFDPSTGKILPLEGEGSQPSTTTDAKWVDFKSRFYGTIDTVSDTADKLRGAGKKEVLKGGYRDLVEESALTAPAQKISNQIQNRKSTQSPTTQKLSRFDSFKESFYSTLDKVQGSPDYQFEKLDQPVISQNYRPVSQVSPLDSEEVKSVVPDLNSRNPLKRYQAEQKIKQLELKQLKKAEAEERQRRVNELKLSVYEVTDSVQSGAKGVVELVKSVPGSVQTVATTVASIPGQVDETITGIQNNVKGGIESTKKFVADVQAVPGRVQETVESTTKSVNDAVTKVNGAVTEVKVFTGLEERKPQPPKTPPPPEKTMKDFAMAATKDVAAEAGKLGIWIGKETLKLGWKGVSTGAGVVASKVVEQIAKTDSKPETWEIRKTTAPAKLDDDDDGVSIMTDTADVEQEIQEALRLAQAALEPKGERKRLEEEVEEALLLAQTAIALAERTGTEPVEESEIDEAVRKAKQAAVSAANDAAEVAQDVLKCS